MYLLLRDVPAGETLVALLSDADVDDKNKEGGSVAEDVIVMDIFGRLKREGIQISEHEEGNLHSEYLKRRFEYRICRI